MTVMVVTLIQIIHDQRSRTKEMKWLVSVSLTLMAKWCELSFLLNSVEFLCRSEDNNSHQSFPWTPLEAARFTEKHSRLLRHSNVQSNASDTAIAPTRGTSRQWNSYLINSCCRKVCVVEVIPLWYSWMFDSAANKKQNTHQVYIIWFISYFILRSDSFTRSKKNPIEFASLPTSGFVTQLVVAR